jgi:SagB-type dehydrogenase family enzyme
VGGVLLSDRPVRLGWRPGFSQSRDGDVVVLGDGRRVARVGAATPWRRTLLTRLTEPDGAPLAQLLADVAGTANGDGPMVQIEARALLHTLAGRGLLGARLVDAEGVAATIGAPTLPDEPVGETATATLSDDVFLRRDGGLVLESASDPARRDPVSARFAAALLGDGELPAGWRAVLLQAGILTFANAGDGRWEFHDRLFHTRSRMWGGAARPYGVTMRLRDAMDPLSAEEIPDGAGPAIALPTGVAAGAGPSLGAVAEGRRSRRAAGARLTVEDLGALLHRVARVRGVRPAVAGDEVDRPVPSAGALGAVGVYALIADCEGLQAGLHHYDGRAHALRAMPSRPEHLAAILGSARGTAGLASDAPVQALLVLVARFGRLQFKYSGMAYAAVLKDVGVLYEALALTTTALGLGGCPLGGGDALAFARASGIDPWVAGSVGEFLLVGKVAAHVDLSTA